MTASPPARITRAGGRSNCTDAGLPLNFERRNLNKQTTMKFVRKLIFVAWDSNKERFVWAMSPDELPSDYIEAWITELQFADLKSGGFIESVTKEGVKVRI